MAADAARLLVTAEERLRAEGLTGGQAFDAMMVAIDARLGGTEAPLPAAVDAVKALPVEFGVDLMGLAYERFFPDLFKGRRGQYFTPPAIARLLVERLALQPGETVLDPACGAGSLLALAQAKGAHIRGIERDPRLARLARFGLRRGGSVDVLQADMFRVPPEPVDVVVANPPFSVPVRDVEVLEAHGWSGKALSDQLFAALLARWVRPGGRAGVVMPASLLTNSSFESTRQQLDESFVRTAVCTLPEGVFRPFGGAAGRAVLLWLTRRPAQSGFMAWSALSDPGYDTRSIALKPTSNKEVDARIRGEGWRWVEPEAWTPPAPDGEGRLLSEVATLRQVRAVPGPVARLDLGDVDLALGEARPVRDEGLAARQEIVAGDVLVSRLRPERGNVVVARGCDDRPVVGSPEWVVLRVAIAPHYTWLALRSPVWRNQLPVTAGQTRPRTSPDAVLNSRIRWPVALVERVDAAAESRLAARAALGQELQMLEAAVHAFMETGDASALAEHLDGLEALP